MASNRKKLDNRIRILIENGMVSRHRTLFVIVGDKGRDQVVILHHILSKASVKARPSVLWCYKKDLGFSSHRKKRMKQLQKKIKSGTLDLKKDDPFELFIASTNIRYCYYTETHKILGNTYGMCVLQDFEALTPNLLARTVETVDGGGIVVLLLRTMSSLKQLYTMTMDVHARYRTESHKDVVGRFNERFILSLASCEKCMVIDDKLNILPISSHTLTITAIPPKTKEEAETPEQTELRELKESLADTPPVGDLVKCTRTLDQAQGLLKCIEAVSEKMLRTTVAMTAARGRGKSATLGLAMAAAIGFGYSNIFVTSPSPENLKTLFEFVFKGFDALELQEHEDYEIIQSTNPEFNKAVVRVNIYHEHRQTVQYIHPSDSHKLGQAELVVIDEAAAIPLPLVRKLMGPHVVFMASTINGYEGTGRSLSLKLIDELRKKNSTPGAGSTDGPSSSSSAGRLLREVTLNEPIRYAAGDNVEKWLYDLLCLNAANVPKITGGCPLPRDCELYYVNRDTLFCYHKASEEFLHRIMSLYVASHYKNTPNDLQLLSDAPAHHVFVLLPPVSKEQTTLPDVLCVLQVCLEGEISRSVVKNSLSRGQRASGDLIPWTISQQFVDHDFASLSGGRVVRIATHPDLQRMGYGSHALKLLSDYYEGRIPSLSESEMEVGIEKELESTEMGDLLTETIKPRTKLPPILCKLSERPPEVLDYLGVSFGLTVDLYKFWNRGGYTPVYIRQTPNDLTGEHSCIMLKTLDTPQAADGKWLKLYYTDFRQRFVSLLSYEFRTFPPGLGISILHQGRSDGSEQESCSYNSEALQRDFTKYDLKRIDLYSRNMADHHMIRDLVPKLSELYFLRKTNFSLSAAQCAILLAMGLQRKNVQDVEADLDLPASQIMGLYNRVIRKFNQMFEEMQTKDIDEKIGAPKEVEMNPVEEELEDELSKAATEIKTKQKKEIEVLKGMDLSHFAISGNDQEWDQVLSSGKTPTMISISSKKTKRSSSEPHDGGKIKTKKEGVHAKGRKKR